jgi:uncharacterized protein (TIGR03437 family)
MLKQNFPQSLALLAGISLAFSLQGAPKSRITRAVDLNRVQALSGNVHRLAQVQADRGAVDPAMPMNFMMVTFKPSAEQQADLDQLLADQINPSSRQYHKWLTPDEYANRFGVSQADRAKVRAWLTSQGLSVDRESRSGNWIAFSGTAQKVSKALHTEIHYFDALGTRHYANTVAPSVPEALSDVITSFIGLHDFRPYSMVRRSDADPGAPATGGAPNYNSGSNHYLAPEDWSTIYNLAPLYNAGIDGTGQTIVVVGESDPVLSDVTAFRTRFNLPANTPKTLFYGGTDPGVDANLLLEANLDMEWAGAVAPKATIYYVYGQNAYLAAVTAIELNLGQVLNISFGSCEADAADPGFRSFFQQANAQGITVVSSSGDTAAAGCDLFNEEFVAAHGPNVSLPNAFPEVTSVGGTTFTEGSGNYWATSNSKNGGSALSYIPEAAWNEAGPGAILGTGGGASQFYPRPSWQQGPGLPNDNIRYVPDVSFSAALHDAYLIQYQGSLIAVFGTSAAAPSFGGLVALLNHYQISKGFQTALGQGNINPQLYRLARDRGFVFHDTTAGDNIVPCILATPGCAGGSFGFKTQAGYDPVTGLGSVDGSALVTEWHNDTVNSSLKLTLDNATQNINGNVTATATVTGAGTAVPTGTVAFTLGGYPLGTVQLSAGAAPTASLTFPVYVLGTTGSTSVSATYSGDFTFSGSGATTRLRITAPTAAAGIAVNAPTSAEANPENAQGPSWETDFSLTEVAGVQALVTGFSIDGVAQPLAKYFPAPAIPQLGTLNVSVVFFNLPAPVTKKFTITGTDFLGNNWTREFLVAYLPLGAGSDFLMTAAPLTAVQNPSADPSCEWPVQVVLTDIGGALRFITTFTVGGIDYTSQAAAIFGTPRLDPYATLRGTVCFGGITPPASQPIYINTSDGAFNEITVNFIAAPPTPLKLTPSPASLSLAASDPSKSASVTLSLDVSDKTQPWNILVTPNNTTGSWLSVTPSSGIGPAKITVTASGKGLGTGAFGGTLIIQSPNASAAVTVPVMFVLGDSSSGIAISSVANPGSHLAEVSPGGLLEIYGSKLANSTAVQSLGTNNYLPYKADGATVTVNGRPAFFTYISPGQLNIQVPYEIGAGPAVIGVNNNGQIAGIQVQVTPASPGIISDASGAVLPTSTVKQGGTTTLYFTGAGDVNPLIISGAAQPSTTPVSSLAVPQLPVSVTVGGQPAFIQFVGIPRLAVGVVQVNFSVSTNTPVGAQPVVVTVNGVASPAATVTVQSAN